MGLKGNKKIMKIQFFILDRMWKYVVYSMVVRTRHGRNFKKYIKYDYWVFIFKSTTVYNLCVILCSL